MSASIDKFLFKVYDECNYTCLHFASDVFEHLTGKRLDACLMCFLFGDGRASVRHSFKRSKAPVSPCVVLFRGAGESHVGVFHEGKVLHLGECGAIYEHISDAIVGFSSVRFYVCQN